MGLSVRIATDFVFTIFWGWLEKLRHWSPSSISWGISSEDYDPGGRTCCTRCSCWGNTYMLLLGDALAVSPRSTPGAGSGLFPITHLSASRPNTTTKTTNNPTQRLAALLAVSPLPIILRASPRDLAASSRCIDARASAAIWRITTSHLGFEEGFSVSRRLQFRASRRHSLTQPSDRALAIAGA